MGRRVKLVALVPTLAVMAVTLGCMTAAITDTNTTPEVDDSTQVVEVDPTRDPSDSQADVKLEGWDRLSVETDEIEPETAAVNESLFTVYFEFGSYDLDEESRENLKQNARWSRTNPGAKIVIEGHCDERGTIEYNLALGERRANAVRTYLQSLGVERERVRIVSYGEERPLSPEASEWAFSRNRRAESVVE